jgi:hypothetical protein
VHLFEIRGAQMALAIAALLCLFAALAFGDDRPWEQPAWRALDDRFLSNGEGPSLSQYWLEPPLHTEEGHGFEVNQSLGLKFEQRFGFSIQGPLIGERAHGLAFEVRF